MYIHNHKIIFKIQMVVACCRDAMCKSLQQAETIVRNDVKLAESGFVRTRPPKVGE